MVLAGAGLGTGLTACEDDAGAPLDDAGADVSRPDGLGIDVGVDASASIHIAKLTFVNAATDFGVYSSPAAGFQAIRLCFKQGTTDANLDYAPFPPLPDRPSAIAPHLPPGLYAGTGEALPNFGIDLSNRILVPILMNVVTLNAKGIINPGNGQPGATCDEILKGNSEAGTLEPNIDYWELPKIEAGTFLRDKSYLLALTGCVTDSLYGPRCGPDPSRADGVFGGGSGPGVGNLKISITELTRTAVSASGLGIQIAHLSSGTLTTHFPPAPLFPGFIASPPIIHSPTFVAATPGGAGVSYLEVTSAQAVWGVDDSHYFVSDQDNPNAEQPTPLRPIPLPEIQRASFGDAAVPTIYTAGKNFVFVLIGDANPRPYIDDFGQAIDAGAPGAHYNPRSYHYLGFPTDPEVSNYRP